MFTREFCEISKDTFFTERVWTTASNLSSIFYQVPTHVVIL